MKVIFWPTIWAAMVLLINAGCGNNTSKVSEINEPQNSQVKGDGATIEIAFGNQYSNHVKGFFESLQENKKIHRYTFEKATKEIGALVSNDVVFTTLKGSARVGAAGSLLSETYKGVKIGGRVLIFKKEFYQGSAERHYRPLTWFAHSVLYKDSEGFLASLEDKIRYVLDTKIYEPIRIGNMNSAIDTVDFIAHFIPGYAGAERTFVTGKTTGSKLLGVVEMVGDAATLGLGSKIRAVKQGAAAIVLTASSIRISSAVVKASQGTAGMADGVDAFIATVEAGLAAVTLVKIKLGPLKHTVSSMDQAKVLSREVGRSADDIYRNGLSSAEIKKMVGDIPALKARGASDKLVDGLVDISNTIGGRKIQSRIDNISCGIGGFGLTMNSRNCYAKALLKSTGGIPQYPEFRSFNDAMTAALSWLKTRTKSTVKGTWKISNGSRKNGGTQIDSFIGRTPQGKTFEINVHFHNVKQLKKEVAHVNVRFAKEKTLPHFIFPGGRADVDAVLKQIFSN
jgi:hypothetical protein